jgi:hypothetical protein
MKKSFLLNTAGLLALASPALLTSCDDRAVGLEPDTKSEQKTAYDGISGAGTATEAPVVAKAPEPVKAPEPAKSAASTPPTPPPPVESTPPPPTPAPTPTPEPAPAPAPTASAGGTVTIKPEMPKPLFAGTPLPENNPPPNLEDPKTKPTLEVQVPAGVTLLSKGKPVTCSDSAPLGELSWITDGDKNGDDGYFVDILPGKHWVQIDLGESKEIHLIWVWHYHKVAAVYKDVVVQISDDPEFKTSTTVFNNDFDNSSEFGVGTDKSWIETNHGRSMPVKGVKGRYVRLWSNGRNVDDTNHYIEVEVYGK